MRTAARAALGWGLLLGMAACPPAPAPEAGTDDAALPADEALSADPAARLADEAAVRAAVASYYDAFSARDWARFADHFWPRATLTTVWTPPGGPAELMTLTIPEFVERAPDGPGSRAIFEERPVSVAVTVAGGLAQAWVHYEARFGDPGDVTEWTGIDAFTLLRHDGAWRIVSLAYHGT